MLFLPNAKTYSFSNFLFFLKIKWIDINNFIIFFERNIFIFRVQRNKLYFPKKFKIKKIFCHTKILNARISLKKKNIIISNSDGILQIKSKNFFNPFQIFFLNFEIDYFKKDFFHDQIIYGIGRLKIKNQTHNNLKKSFCLILINLQEGIFLNVFKFKNFWFNEDLFCLAERQKTIIIAHENRLLFFYFDYEEKKIFKSSISNDFEICLLKFHESFLVFGDKKGQIFFVENFDEKKIFKKKVKDSRKLGTLLKKKKLFFFPNPIRKTILQENKIIGFFFFRSRQLLIFNLIKKKKKKLFLIQKNEILGIKSFFGKNVLLFVTSDLVFFFLKNKKRWKFLNYQNRKPLKILWAPFFVENKKFFEIEIFHWSFFSKKIFCIFSAGNFLDIINLKKSHLKKYVSNFSNFFLQMKLFENSITLKQDYIGKKIFIFSILGIFQINLKKFFWGKNFKLAKKKVKNFSSEIKRFNKKFKACIDKKGKNLCILFPKGEIQIWNTKSFSNLKKNFKKVLNFSKKKINLICFSNDGNFLGIIVSKILIIWKIFPKFLKFNSLNLCFEEEIGALKFFTFKKTQNFLISSKNEFCIFNIEKNLLFKKIKLTIVQLTTDFWFGKFAGIFRFFYPKNLRKKHFIAVFRGFCSVPIFLIDIKNLSNKNILSLNLSYSKKKKKLRGLIIDSLLKFHKIFF